MNNTTNSITTEQLDIAYDEALIVKALDMNIPHGKITSIIGPNGCGKSTVLKAVGRILKPKTGLVYLSGEDIRKLSTKDVAKKDGNSAANTYSSQRSNGERTGGLWKISSSAWFWEAHP